MELSKNDIKAFFRAMLQIEIDFEDIASGLKESLVFSNYLPAKCCSTCCYSGQLNISECQVDMEVKKGVFLNKASVRGGIKNQALMAALDLTN